MALNIRHYNEQHNGVMTAITRFLENELDSDFIKVADPFPPDLATTNLRPDIVLFSSLRKEAVTLNSRYAMKIKPSLQLSSESQQHMSQADHRS